MNYIDELNLKQFEAVTSIDKYLRIIAGAGSGKTRVLTYRIAYLIEKMNVYPYNILAITFTNKVANEMLERTLSLLPNYDLRYLQISTFHSFCARFLRQEIGALNITPNFVIFDEDDQQRLLKTIAENKGYKKSDDIVKESLNFIGKEKTIGRLPSAIKESDLKPNEKKYYNFYLEYEQRKADCKALDFDDLLIYTIKILNAFPEIKEKYNKRFEHILIDEFQDTNDLQFNLLTLLMGKDTNLYVVGDPDQTIYTWRGANQEIILNMNKVFSPIKTIILNENYRSTTEILKVSNKLISYNGDRVKKDLFTNNSKGKQVSIECLDNAALEGNYIAKKILELKFKNPNFSYKDVAILYRSSYLSLKIENALTSFHIPYKVYGGIKFYSRKEIKDCLAYFKLLINEDDDVSFERIINVPRRKIGEVSTKILVAEASSNNISIIKYLRNIHHYDTSLKAPVINKLLDLIFKLDETRVKIDANYEAYSEVLDEFITEIGYKDYLEENDETKDKIENIRALIDDIRSFLKSNPDSCFADYLQNVSLLSYQDDIEDVDNVSLMTVHTAKGLEFDYVFVIGLNQGVFPNSRALNLGNNVRLEEERRLAYVAFTRAKKELYLTLNKDYSFTMHANNIPSQFIKEAGIEFSSYRFKPLFTSEDKTTYRYNSNKPLPPTDKKDVINLSIRNNINWKVGDTVMHKAFGEGKIIRIEDGLLTINFIDFGQKTILGTHPTLSKKE